MLLPSHIVLASHNKGKLREIADLLAPHNITLQSIADFGDDEPVEDGGTYLANATIKAQAAARLSSLPCLAEDSGVECAAWPGKLGVETAPEVAAFGGWLPAMAALAKDVAATGNDRMDFHSTFVLALPNGSSVSGHAVVTGAFVHPARGAEGFGHDPYFIPQAIEGFHHFVPAGETRTYGEMPLPDKQALSPRRLALNALLAKLTPTS